DAVVADAGTAIEQVIARRAGDAVAAQPADDVFDRNEHIVDRGRGGAALGRAGGKRDEQGICLANVGDSIDACTAGQGVDAQSTAEGVVAGCTREGVTKPIADQRIGTRATGYVFDAGEGGKARGTVRCQVDGDGRGGGRAIAQRVAAVPE